MSPIGNPFDPGEFGRSATGENHDGMRRPGQASPAPARPACRPLRSARRDGPPRR